MRWRVHGAHQLLVDLVEVDPDGSQYSSDIRGALIIPAANRRC
jgi:hypothetical protein